MKRLAIGALIVITKLLKGDPYPALVSKNLYETGVFDQTLNGNCSLSVVEKSDKYRTVLIERSFWNGRGKSYVAGYAFIQCLPCRCEEDNLRAFRSLLEEIVKTKAKGNYMEVEPILCSFGFSDEVIRFVDQYNSFQRRKPIQLFSYEAP